MSEIIKVLEQEYNKKSNRLDKVYMNIAKEVATLSYCVRSQVGAILVKDGNIISMGYNGTPKGFDNCCEDTYELDDKSLVWVSKEEQVQMNIFEKDGKQYGLKTKPEVLHAEMNAVLKAAKTGNAVQDSTLYITLMPCLDCAKYLLQSGIKRVVYLNEYRDTKGVELLKQYIKVDQFTNEVF